MSNLINRADAIEVMWKALYAYEDLTEKQFMEHEELELGDWFRHRIFVQRMHEECMKAVEELPSAETPTKTPTVSEKRQLSEETPTDLISRRDAIDEIKALYEWHDTVTEDRAVDHIKRLPSAEPKTGKWVKVIDQETPNVTKWHYECDQCGAGRFEKCQKYCSRCGAMMIREDGEA